MTRGKIAVSLAVAATVLAIAAPTNANAQSAGNWSEAAALPTGTGTYPVLAYSDPVGGALYFYVNDAVPTLSRVEAEGTLDQTAAVPSITGEVTSGIPEQIAFRPDGSSIVAWKVQGTGHAYMAFRAESGQFGKPVLIDQNFRYLAVSGGEVMVLSADGTTVGQAPFTLSAKGALAAAGAPSNIYVGSADHVYAAIDSSGVADVIVQGIPASTSTSQITDINRNAAGSWGTGTALSDPTNDVTDVSFATNPSGKAAVTWTESTSDSGTE